MQRSQRGKYRLLQRSEGASAVESAIVLPVLLLLVCGIMDFGIIFFQMHNVNEAAREGARQTAVSQNLPTAASTTIAYIKSNYDNHYNVTVVPSPPVSGSDVTVTVTNSVTIITPIVSVFFPSNPYMVTGRTVMRVE
jgi:Flp pilus assembly protein TadG